MPELTDVIYGLSGVVPLAGAVWFLFFSGKW